MTLKIPFLSRSEVRIRPAEIADAMAIAAIHAGSFAHAWSQMTIEAMLTERSVIATVATERSVRGFILSRRALDEAEILSVAVDPSMRRTGMAGRLLASHLEDLARHRVRTVFLEVAVDNIPAVSLYSHRRFVEVGRRKGYYRTPTGTNDALTMRRDLDDIVLRPPGV